MSRTEQIEKRKKEQQKEEPKSEQKVYAVTLYDFYAERADELTVREGDKLIIHAESTKDWFVAEHADKQSNVGLVPVTYVAMIEPDTNNITKDIGKYLEKYQIKLPDVEDWKRETLAEKKEYEGRESERGYEYHSNTSSGDHQDSLARLRGQTMIVGSRVGEGISGKGYHSMIGLSSMGQGSGQEGSDVAAGAVRVQRLQVPSFISKDGEYLYLLEYTLVNRSKGRVYRSWDDFMEFYNVITQQNPGIVGSMQHKLLNKSGYAFMTDGIASRRRSELNLFIQELIKVFPSVLSSTLLFGLLQLSASGHQISSKLYRTLSDVNTSKSPSIDSHSGLSQSFSTLSHPPFIKVKVLYNSEIIALKVPDDCSLPDLLSRLYSRLPISAVNLVYRTNSGSFLPLRTDLDWANALALSANKPVLQLIS